MGLPPQTSYFVRYEVEQVRVAVHIVEATDFPAAKEVPLTQETRQGYYTDDSDTMTKSIPLHNLPAGGGAVGPFDTKEAAEKSEAGWIEDV